MSGNVAKRKKAHNNFFHEFGHFCYPFCADAQQDSTAKHVDEELWPLLHRASAGLLQSAGEIGIHPIDKERVGLDCSSYRKS